MNLLVDGRNAYAYTGGKPFDASLPCVVMIHGASNDHSVWTLLARWCAHHGHCVLALDLPGHMKSAGPPLHDVPALARWVLAAMHAAGVQRAALVGHSMGSLIALDAAGQAPDRASALVMIGTAYPMKVSDALLGTARGAPERAMAMVNAWSISTLASKPGFPSPGSWLHGGALALMRRVQRSSDNANLFLHDFEVCNGYAGGLEAAAKVSCPATMILGRNDQMTPPRAAKEIAAALEACTVLVNSGHHQLAETPDATLAALREALAATRPGSMPG